MLSSAVVHHEAPFPSLEGNGWEGMGAALNHLRNEKNRTDALQPHCVAQTVHCINAADPRVSSHVMLVFNAVCQFHRMFCFLQDRLA